MLVVGSYEDHHRSATAQRAGDGQAVLAWHFEIEENKIGFQLEDFFGGFCTVCSFAGDLESGSPFDQLAQNVPGNGLVVHDQSLQRVTSFRTGIDRETTVPDRPVTISISASSPQQSFRR